MTAAEKIFRLAKSLMQVSGYRLGAIPERLRGIAFCEAYLGKTHPRIAAPVERAADLWLVTGSMIFLEEEELTAEELQEATWMIHAKAAVAYEVAYNVWVLELDGVLTASFHSETPELAFPLIWRRLCPAQDGWEDERLRDALMATISKIENSPE